MNNRLLKCGFFLALIIGSISAVAFTVESPQTGIDKEFVEEKPDEEIEARLVIRPRTGDVCVTKAGVNLRSSPSISAKSIQYLQKGHWIAPSWNPEIDDDGNQWIGVTAFQIGSGNRVIWGKSGYIRIQYQDWSSSGRVSNNIFR